MERQKLNSAARIRSAQKQVLPTSSRLLLLAKQAVQRRRQLFERLKDV